ncbi:epoxide hydrolase [Microlunatus antarcticus]
MVIAGPDAAPPVVPEAELDDLRRRLAGYRRVALPAGHGWERGTDGDVLAELVTHWHDAYDWREHEARLRNLPWVLTTDPTTPVRAIRTRGTGEGRPTVVLLHGWPDSVLRFTRVLPLLTDVDVVVPALPGFPFAAPVERGGLSAWDAGTAVAAALEELGVERYVLSAGDVGTDVAEAVAAQHPDRVAALHLTDVTQMRYLLDPPGDLTAEEAAFVERGHRWQAAEGAYGHEQSTRPHTLAVGLGDSPAGLAAWLVEKLRSWTDCAGDVGAVFSRDELLTWVTAYWTTGAIGTSFTPYVEASTQRRPGRILPPAVFTIFPHDLANPPRSWAERFFDVAGWQELEAGGHFAAWERPDEYAAGVRAALRLAEGTSPLRSGRVSSA